MSSSASRISVDGVVAEPQDWHFPSATYDDARVHLPERG